VESSVEDVPIAIMTKRYGGAIYVFSVGMRNSATEGNFQVRDVPAEATAEVIGEERSISVKDGRFQDDFAAYDVHLYRIQGN
jgi:hypothetical protein